MIRWLSWWVKSQVGLVKLWQKKNLLYWQFRERKYPLLFDGDMEHSLQRANCQKGLHRRGNRRMLRNKITERGKLQSAFGMCQEKNMNLNLICTYHQQLLLFPYTPNTPEKNKKRDVRYWNEPTIAGDRVREDHRNQEVPTEVERGDIPVLNGDCEGRLPSAFSNHVDRQPPITLPTADSR